jgi:preprotein translocase subunit SecE
MNKVLAFLQEVKTELLRIVWPKRDDLVGSAIVVCIIAVAFAIVLGFMDFSFRMLVKRLVM